MIEVCMECNTEIEFSGDPQYVRCPKCGIIQFRYTWDMCMSPEELATENLLDHVPLWFTDRSWVGNLP